MKSRIIKHESPGADRSRATGSGAAQAPKQSRNLAASVGGWSARHWKTAVFGWLAFVAAAFVVGGMVGTKTLVWQTSLPGESGDAERILYEDFRPPASEAVLIQSERTSANDTSFDAAIRDVVAGLGSLRNVVNLRSPLDPQNPGQISPDGHSALVSFQIRGNPDEASGKIGPILDRIESLQAAHPQLYIAEFGEVSSNEEVMKAFKGDLEKAGMFSLPLTLIILVVAFGALVAAGVPLLVGLTAVLATIGLVGPISHLLPMDESVSAIVLLIGLAVGVDYSLFYIRREREERRAGKSAEEALAAAAATSGRSVLISGLTVMTAIAGLLFAGNPIFSAFGIGTMLVVAVTVLGSLTFLPATLSLLAQKNWLEKGRVPYVTSRRHKTKGESRVWGFVLTRVLKRPRVVEHALGPEPQRRGGRARPDGIDSVLVGQRANRIIVDADVVPRCAASPRTGFCNHDRAVRFDGLMQCRTVDRHAGQQHARGG